MSEVFEDYVTSARGSTIGAGWLERRPIHATAEDPRRFDKLVYSREIHSPVILFSTGNHLKQPLPRCLDLPLRLKGESDYHIPEEWTSLLPLLVRIFKHEHGSNPNWKDDYFTYMTIDSSLVETGQQQRRGGLHVDGFQGARIKNKTKVTRNYVASSNGGTRFYPQLFESNINESVFNLFTHFEKQARDFIVVPENTVTFMDAYSVHESGLARRGGLRTFLRVTYDCKEFDRLGNSHNSMIDYSWPMVKRTTQQGLI